MSIEFPLNKKRITLGEVPDPVITIEVLTTEGFLPFEFILDTGADCTVLPKHMAKLAGVDLSCCKQTRTYGLKNEPLKVYIGEITIEAPRASPWVPSVFDPLLIHFVNQSAGGYPPMLT